MSEELLQTIPLQIGKYTYFRLGNTTLKQLRDHQLIPRRSYDTLDRKKPDGLVVYHGEIRAVVEYKPPSELKTDRAIAKAINQELKVAKALCKVMIVTDGTKSYWVNALNGERIKDQQGQDLRALFHPFVAKNTLHLEHLLDEVVASIDQTNSTIRSARLIDPTPLATRLWQTIWVATGKSPVKCLYNVVELFIFKFLSDLKVLPEDIAFGHIYSKALAEPAEALDFYARNTRKRIYKLFPQGSDGTTIINGTIFVNERGDANLTQAILFQRSLKHLHRYTEEFGSLTKIDKQFKTKLYESFLQQEVEALGQYFTPRKIIQSVIRMAGLDLPSFQFNNQRICDPFCGVGGFLVELLNLNENMLAAYEPGRDGKIDLPFTLHGFDKGFERDEERTIILAKANLLIYLAELLFTHPTCSIEFAGIFNETFRLFKDNLGTFGHIISKESEKYDYILSNPPYVTRGSSVIKEEIRQTARTADAYPVNALGLEGLSVEWIVRSLKAGGRAFIIVPDGILGRIGERKLRTHILRECYIDAIVSLPVRTFFANAEHTYILAITKKHRVDDRQTAPVFTYLVSNIGERLTSVKREGIEADDMPEMERLFRVFMADREGAKEYLERLSLRCKIQNIERFYVERHWVIDRWWARLERIAMGDEEVVEAASRQNVEGAATAFSAALADFDQFIQSDPVAKTKRKEVALGDKSLFELFIGNRVTSDEVSADSTLLPVYSANVFKPMGYIEVDQGNLSDFLTPSILWGIDGNFEFNLIPPDQPFASTDHCGTIKVLDSAILPEYVLYALHLRRIEESYDRAFRASLSNMREFALVVPVDSSGAFDVEAQRKAAARFSTLQMKRAALVRAKEDFDAVVRRYMGAGHL
ncbi:MAG: N-6 DNA methylase [Thermoanaerobaculia bacterium]